MSAHWQTEARDTVYKMFPQSRLRTISAGLATCTPRAVDYLRQAPILAVAAADPVLCSVEASFHAGRTLVVGRFCELVKAQPKLRTLMASYGIAYAFRALQRPTHSSLRVVRALSKAELHPSALAQAIPNAAVAQARWLRLLKEWLAQVDRRSDRLDFGAGLDWLATALGPHPLDVTIVANGIRDLADFFIAHHQQWNRGWSFDQATNAAIRWHYAYAPLPREATAGGFRFVALDSAEALQREGRAMHHCVASYLGDVVRGKSRIYSIRVDEAATPIATLEVQPTLGGLWQIEQIRGPYNRPVDESMIRAAFDFLAAFNPFRYERQREKPRHSFPSDYSLPVLYDLGQVWGRE